MAEENIKEVIEEIQGADEETLRTTVEKWFESTRNQGLKIGAQYMSAAVFETIRKNIIKNAKPSLGDYKRCVNDIMKIVSVQLTQSNNTDVENDIIKEDCRNG